MGRRRQQRLTEPAVWLVMALLFGRLIAVSVLASSSSSFGGGEDQGDQKPPVNLLFIVLDQLRFDGLQHVQEKLPQYRDKLKIRTPNIDRLAQRGAIFDTAYCVSTYIYILYLLRHRLSEANFSNDNLKSYSLTSSAVSDFYLLALKLIITQASPSCGPARASLVTGNTLQRTGVSSNKLIMARHYSKLKVIRQKVEALESFEQVLVERLGYKAESYGKFHIPTLLAYKHQSRRNFEDRVITANSYDFQKSQPFFSKNMNFREIYQEQLGFLVQRDHVQTPYRNGYQQNYYTKLPYKPIRIDPRWGAATKTPLTQLRGFENKEIGNSNIFGEDALSEQYTRTGVLGAMAVKALERLTSEYDSYSGSGYSNATSTFPETQPQQQRRYSPFSLSVHVRVCGHMMAEKIVVQNVKQETHHLLSLDFLHFLNF